MTMIAKLLSMITQNWRSYHEIQCNRSWVWLDEFGDGNPEWQLTFDEETEIRDLALGVWEAEDEDDLIEEITSASGWCIRKIDYEIQLKWS